MKAGSRLWLLCLLAFVLCAPALAQPFMKRGAEATEAVRIDSAGYHPGMPAAPLSSEDEAKTAEIVEAMMTLRRARMEKQEARRKMQERGSRITNGQLLKQWADKAHRGGLAHRKSGL